MMRVYRIKEFRVIGETQNIPAYPATQPTVLNPELDHLQLYPLILAVPSELQRYRLRLRLIGSGVGG